jgi:hypothetical protein
VEKRFVETGSAGMSKFVFKPLSMSKEEVKQQLQQYIDSGDEKLLRLMYVVAREYNNEDHPLDDTEIQMLEERWKDYKSGKNSGYSWDEVIEAISKRKKENNG